MSDRSGVTADATTPVGAGREINQKRLPDHCKWLLEAGDCDAVNFLVTTGEATSLSMPQRSETIPHISKFEIRTADVPT